MRGLTLIQPWASCITHGDKRVENRTWAPPTSLLGQRFAIHAGKAFDDDSLAWMFDHGLRWPSLDPWPHGVVLGTARLVGVLRDLGPLTIADGADSRRVLALSGTRWFVGPIGWVLDEVVALKRPIACRGAQGLWTLPPDVEAQVSAQLPRAA